MIRRGIPWSTCVPGKRRPCFDAQIGKCPGVCTGRISKMDYRRIIRQLMLFFDGKKVKLERELKKEMTLAAKKLQFENAAMLRRRLSALEHIQDIALISREDYELPFTKKDSDGSINLLGRIEAYDISNLSGTSAVGSMVVFEDGKPVKHLYRKFKIKTVTGTNDVAMLEVVMWWRVGRAQRGQRGQRAQMGWELPQVMIIDGGEPQVNRVQAVLDELGVKVPIMGIAKGFDRKQDRLVFDRTNKDLSAVAVRGKELFQKARDEAHRFAVKYHRTLRGKQSIRST
jgi:excinuclease ABC subunit C